MAKGHCPFKEHNCVPIRSTDQVAARFMGGCGLKCVWCASLFAFICVGIMERLQRFIFFSTFNITLNFNVDIFNTVENNKSWLSSCYLLITYQIKELIYKNYLGYRPVLYIETVKEQ